jgi:hypothetical protein
MKTLLLITCIFAMASNGYATDIKNITFDLKNGESLRLVYDSSARDEQPVQVLYLKSDARESKVSSIQARHQIYADGSHGKTPYERCSIAAADHHADRLLVLFSYETGRQKFFQGNQLQRGYAKPLETEEDMLLVLYRNDNNTWKTEISVFIQTMWGDAIGENVSEVKFTEELSFNIRFDRKWRIEGASSKVLDERRKIIIPGGIEEKSLTFDPEDKSLFATGARGLKFLTSRAVWWAGENRDHIEYLRQRWDERMRAEHAAREKGVDLPIEDSPLSKLLKSKGVMLVDIEVFPEANGHQNSINITRDLRKARPEQNKAQHPTDGAPKPEKPKE